MTMKTDIRRAPFALAALAGLALLFGSLDVAGAQGRGQGQGQEQGQGQGGPPRSCSQAEVRQAESQSGGQMMSVSQSVENGSTVCHITVLVPSQDNGKPRRTVITIRP
ncbi:hypothetical protein DYI37_07785 [Fulvimarina endophytica]|uniref:Uncharacterized protein n=1 Tax=Fulvimarina endophytica TaxID=2293836 RepID=A0A371X4R7_9HYPH|nr:hypothetical protein [Fulvimarina endophytica]RFC64232.1 hypothetical protein DYI37_07785 [Fulvimarina endophytica]